MKRSFFLMLGALILVFAPPTVLAQQARTISLGDLFKKATQKSPPAARASGPQADIARLRERYDAEFVVTRLPGIYAAKSHDMLTATARLFTGDGQITMNNGTLGMTSGISGARLSEVEQEAIIRPLLPHFGTDELLQFGPASAPLRMLVLSAVDCGYCAKLEPQLAAKKMRYAVIPGALFDENEPMVNRIYCTPDRSRAWLQVLASGKAPASMDTGCEYDRQHFWVLSGLLGGSTPRLVFADGDLMRPTPDAAGIARILAKLKELEQAGVAFD